MSARVQSIDALKDFKAAICEFCEEARESLCAIDMEIRRTLQWLEHEQLPGWRKAIRDREEEVSEAKNELFRRQLARVAGEMPDCTEQIKALRRAQARLAEAEEKVKKCRHWLRHLPREVEEYEGPARQLAGMVEGDPPSLALHLEKILAALEAYLDLTPPSAPVAQEKGDFSLNATTEEKE